MHNYFLNLQSEDMGLAWKAASCRKPSLWQQLTLVFMSGKCCSRHNDPRSGIKERYKFSFLPRYIKSFICMGAGI